MNLSICEQLYQSYYLMIAIDMNMLLIFMFVMHVPI
jgi:hypothetical protein